MIKWTEEKTKKIYKELCEKNNNKPLSHNDIVAAGYSTLVPKIIEYFGNKESLELELGLQPLRKKWSRESTKKVYNELCIKNGGRSVSQGECALIPGLNSAISKFFKDKNELNNELNIQPLRQNWSKESVKEIYNELCIKNGHKSTTVPKTIYGSDLRKAIRKYFGTKENLDIELGYTTKRITRTRETVINEYKELCIKNGNKPLKHEELNNRHQGLSDAIGRKFGRKMDLDILLGYKPVMNFNWNKDTIREKYHKLCLENGDKPIPGDKLVEMGHNDLVTAISRHYKKVDLDNDLGYDTIVYWDEYLVKKTYENLCLYAGNRPISDTELRNMGYGNLVAAIKIYYKGKKTQLDIDLGYNPENMFKLIDGTYVRSGYEVLLCNFLIHNEINFEYDKKISDKLNVRYDFLVKDINNNDVYIELWGYTGTSNNERVKSYNKVRIKKEEIYNSLNKKLVGIDGKIFKERNYLNLQDDLIKILKDNLIKIKNFKKLTIKEIIFSEHTSLWNAENTKDLYHKLCLENGDKSISQKIIKEMGYGPLYKAIYKYFNSKRELDIELGYRPGNIIRNKEEIFKDYFRLSLSLGVELITSDSLRQYGNGLDSAIYKNFESRHKFNEEYKEYKESLQYEMDSN